MVGFSILRYQLTPSPSMQAYNDVLDCRLFDYLSIEVDSTDAVIFLIDINFIAEDLADDENASHVLIRDRMISPPYLDWFL